MAGWSLVSNGKAADLVGPSAGSGPGMRARAGKGVRR